MKTQLTPICALFRQLNFNGSSAQQAKLHASLKHSFRLENKNRSIEWNENLSHLNFIYTAAGYKHLERMSHEEKGALIKEIMAPSRPKQPLAKLRKQKRQYTSKLKKAIASEKKQGNSDAVFLLTRLLETPKAQPLKWDVWLSNAESCTFSRRQQRLNMMKTFVRIHNLLSPQPENRRQTQVQESIFKIPHCWNVGEDVVSGIEMAEMVKTFYLRFFPQYPIKCMLIHGDERSMRWNGSEKEPGEKTGTHVHVYVDACNTVTHQCDLRVSWYQVSELALKKLNPGYQSIAHTRTSFSRSEQSAFGESIQLLFKTFANSYLFKKKGLVMQFTPENERRSALRREMDRQAKLAKRKRDFSYFTREIDLAIAELEDTKSTLISEQLIAELHLEDSEKKQKVLEVQNTKAEIEFNARKEDLVAVRNQLSDAHLRMQQLEEDITIKLDAADEVLTELNKDRERLTQEVTEKRSLLAQITDAIIARLKPVLTSIIQVFVLQQRDAPALRQQLEQRLDSQLAGNDYDPLSQQLINTFKDIVLDSAMNAHSQNDKPGPGIRPER